MAYDEALAQRVRAALLGQPGVDEKKMFGGVCFMVAGHMCCGVLKDELIVRTGPDGFDALVAQPHVRPFDFTGRPMVGMLYVGGDALDSDAALAGWVQRGLDFVRLQPTPARRRSSRRR